jgi:hypothetical protein
MTTSFWRMFGEGAGLAAVLTSILMWGSLAQTVLH